MATRLLLGGFLIISFSLLIPLFSTAQSTSWKGTTNNKWSDAANWTNGIPTSATDVIIGDASYTGTSGPTVSATAYCKNLTIGGSISAKLIVKKTIYVGGTLNLNSNGTLEHQGTPMYLKGDWNNAGTYIASGGGNVVNFSGVEQTINGPLSTIFKVITIALGSTVTLTTNIAVNNQTNINGTLNPGISPGSQITGNKTIRVNAGGTLRISAATISGNYNTSTITVSAGSTIEYSGTINQTIANYTYSTLAISGSGIKSPVANLSNLTSSAISYGNVYVRSATLDIAGFTLNRGTSTVGGTLSVSDGATLRIGGTAPLPINYNVYNFTSGSTVQYYGNNQTISSRTYGNLTLSGTSGAVTKTFPATAFTIAGNFSSIAGTATSVTYTTASNIMFMGNVSIGATTTFNAGSNTQTIAGDFTNNGTFTGGTGTVIMTGTNEYMSGAGTHNFNNFTLSGDSIFSTISTLNIAGNFATTDIASFNQTSGTLNLTGTTRTISGKNINLNDVTVNGTITSSSVLRIAGNLSVSASRSLVTSGGLFTMTGLSKTISSSGTLNLSGLSIDGTVTTASSFTISSSLSVAGTFSATAGAITFSGISTLTGTANLFNVVVNGTSLQLANNAELGIAGTYTLTAGALNVTSTTPNTVNFNGTAAQNIPSATFHNLTLSGSVKTAVGAITANGNVQINGGTTFGASTFTHIIRGNISSSGTFTPGTGTIQFAGTADATITGIATFNNITVNKTSASNTVNLLNNVSVATINMTLGTVNTGTATLTITNTRTGGGTIFGSVLRTHAFTTGVAYAFAGQYNTITFTAASGVTSILVKTTAGSIEDFPYGSSIKRLYEIAIPAGTYTAVIRLQYDDVELNGNIEDNLKLWKFVGSWGTPTKTANSSTLNYVELSGVTSASTRWTLSDDSEHILNWNGSVSNNWATPANWTIVSGTPSLPPGVNDAVQIGYTSYANAPQISTAAVIKKLQFGSAVSSTLSLTTGGSLTVQGQLSGVWTANASHTINTNGQALTVTGDVILSEGTVGRSINLNIGAGSITASGSVTQAGDAAITFSGAGNLNLGNHFNYASGAFTRGSGTVNYTGTLAQTVAPVNYNNITINKASGSATLATATLISGNLTATAGTLEIQAAATVTGNVTIATGATINNGSNILLAGNWSNNGNFNSSGSSVTFNGTGAQSISATSFNNLVIDKTAGTASLAGNVTIVGNVTLTTGTLNLGTFTLNRNVAGGILTMATNATLQVGGAANFPANFSTNTLAAASTVNFNGTVPQTMPAMTYGNLVVSNGSANAKTFSAAPTINGDLTINSGSTLNAGASVISLFGNWTNNGTYTQGTSSVNLRGNIKTITGTTTFSKLTIQGNYSVSGSNITTAGLLSIPTGGRFEAGSGLLTLNGDLTNNGTFTSAGTVTFAGNAVQNLQFANAVSTALNTVNFNGTISPVFSGSSVPEFNTVNINNTAPIVAGTGWRVNNAFTVAAGATFTGGTFTHNFYGSFTNNGTVSSGGNLQFLSSVAQNIRIRGTAFTSTSDVTFGGTGAITITGTANTLTDVIISNTAGVTPTAALAVTRDFIIPEGGVFNGGSFSHTVAGNINSLGALNGGTSTFTMTGTAVELAGSALTNFNHLVIAGTVAATNDYNVTGNFTNNGTYDGTGGKLTLTGTTTSTITGSAATFALAQFGVQKSTGIAVSLLKNVNGVSLVDVISGTLDLSTFTVTQDAIDGGSLYVDGGATIRVGGTNTLPSFTDYILDSLSTVELYGSTQSISAVPVYGNLLLSAAGNKTAGGALNIRNNITISNATFIPGNFVDTLGGSWLMSSGTFTNTGSTILFDGSADQSISSTGSFNSIKVNKASGSVNLNANTTVNGIVTFVSGTINTSTYTLIVPSTGSVSGAAQNTGWVIGKLQKNFATGSNVSRTYELGINASFTPVILLAASVSVAGNITAAIISGDHPNLSVSELEPATSVNKYWSFTNSTTVFTTCSATLSWTSAEVDAGVLSSDLKGGQYSASTWSYTSFNSPGATSIQLTGLTALAELVVAANKLPYWTGNTSTDWTVATNWSTGATPTNFTTVTIPTGRSRYPVITAATSSVMVNNLTVQTGATLTILGSLQVYGTISATANSIFADSGTLVMRGTATQEVPASVFNNELFNLTINNAAGVSLGGPLKLTNVLSIQDGSLNTNDHLTLKSTVNATARVGMITSSSPNPIVGRVTVERYVAGRRKYRLITSPVTTSTASVLGVAEAGQSIWGNWQNAGIAAPGAGTIVTGGSAAGGFDQGTSSASMFTYNESTKRYVGFTTANGKNTKQTPLKAGEGYYMFVYGDRVNSITSSTPNPTTLKQTGTLLTGQQVYTTASAIPLSATIGNFSLIGNPYASIIDWRSVTKFNVSKTIWGWDANLSSTGGYVTVTATALGALISPLSTVIAVNRFVQPGQAFFVQTIGANPQLTINESDKVDDRMNINSNVFREEGINEQPLMAINLQSNNGVTATLYDGALVAFDNSFDNGVNEEDGLKFSGSSESLALQVDDKILGINARKYPANNDTVRIMMSRITRSQYTLQVFAKQMTNYNLQPWLYDAFLDKLQALSLSDTNYINFTVKSSDAASYSANRFSIVFKDPATLPVKFSGIIATRKNAAVEVTWNVSTESNVARYEVLRSPDGQTFKHIASVAPKGNNNLAQQYTITDKNANEGSNYYQVVSFENDGKKTMSKIVLVRMDNNTPSVKVFPNPVSNNHITLQLLQLPSGTYRLKMTNTAGQRVVESQVFVQTASSKIELDFGRKLASGTYFLQITNGPHNYKQAVIVQ